MWSAKTHSHVERSNSYPDIGRHVRDVKTLATSPDQSDVWTMWIADTRSLAGSSDPSRNIGDAVPDIDSFGPSLWRSCSWVEWST